MLHLPDWLDIEQHIECTTEPDVAGAVRCELTRLGLEHIIHPGQSVALTAGSRGIANIPTILRETVAHLRTLGAEPFIVPAMGSHGGGTPEAQTKVLTSYGITPETVGAPIRATMEVVELGRIDGVVPIVMDRLAFSADHIGVVARVKPHTSFDGRLESGLCKMMMIGLGKHEGAKNCHLALLTREWEPFLRAAARTILAHAPIRFGLALVENAVEETLLVRGVLPPEVESVEEELLEIAKRNLPRLPYDHADLLIVDEIGKEISGTGMDTNVIGRKFSHGSALPPIRRVFVRNLTRDSDGNATGIGIADFTTQRLVDRMDYVKTCINSLAARHPEAAKLPVHFAADRQVIEEALPAAGLVDFSTARIMHIRNTLQTTRMSVSAAYDLAAAQTKVTLLGQRPFVFDEAGNLAHPAGQDKESMVDQSNH